MKEQIISFETAKLAKEKGFYKWFDEYSQNNHSLGGWEVNDQYLDEVELPAILTLYLIQKWLREKYKISVVVTHGFKITTGVMFFSYIIDTNIRDYGEGKRITYDRVCSTYEEALEAGLKEALNLIP